MSIEQMKASMSAEAFNAKAVQFGKLVGEQAVADAVRVMYDAGPQDEDGTWARYRDEVMVPKYLAAGQEIWGEALTAAELAASFDITIGHHCKYMILQLSIRYLKEALGQSLSGPEDVEFVEVDNVADFVRGPATLQ